MIADVHDELGEALAVERAPPPSFATPTSAIRRRSAISDFAVATFGGLHVMVNNAGISSPLRRGSSKKTSRSSTRSCA